MTDTDRTVIACNYVEATKIAKRGARAWVMLHNRGNGNDRIVVLVWSRGGRYIRKYEDIRRLHNFRVKTLPPEHKLYDAALYDYEPAEMAAELTAAHERIVATRPKAHSE